MADERNFPLNKTDGGESVRAVGNAHSFCKEDVGPMKVFNFGPMTPGWYEIRSVTNGKATLEK